MIAQRLWSNIEPAASLPEEVKTMSKVAADPNDPVVQFNRAAQALRKIERGQKASFAKWGEAWKARKAAVLADIGDEAFKMLRAGNVISAREETIRDEAIKAKALQEDTGNDETMLNDELIDTDGDGAL